MPWSDFQDILFLAKIKRELNLQRDETKGHLCQKFQH